MDVIFVCHTEFGFTDGTVIIGDKKATDGVTKGVLALVALAEKYQAKITFCVCPETVPYFPKSISHEVGLHIHPGVEELQYGRHRWLVGDQYLLTHCKQSVTSTALRDYPYEEQLAMIAEGKKVIEEKMGRQVKVFAAGRWSVNQDTVRALVKVDITHDLSAPAHSSSDHYDWSKLPRIAMPYHPSERDYQLKGSLPLLVVPVSQTLFGGTASLEGETIYGLPWLKACFEEYYGGKAPVFHMSIHSPAMTAPYYISIMEKFLSFIAKHRDIHFLFASEVTEYPARRMRTNPLPYLSAVNAKFLATALRRSLGMKTIYR